MQEVPVSIKTLILIGLAALLIPLVQFFLTFAKNDTSVVFCDVGQGDATYIRIKNSFDILVDTGGDRKILDCLGKYMPFFDHDLELVIFSHLQSDHIKGFQSLIGRYRVKRVIEPASSAQPANSKISQDISNYLKQEKIPVTQVSSEDKINISQDILYFLWPKKSNLKAQDDNESSLIFFLQEQKRRILFTGDIPVSILNLLSEQYNLKTDVLKVSHHGSKSGLNQNFLKLANPTISVISVGKNNPYHHPSTTVLELFKAEGHKYLRTDKNGSVSINLSAFN